MPPELFSSHLDRPRFVPENTPQPTNLTDEPELLNLKRLLQERGLFTEKIGRSLTHKDLHELWQCLNLQKPEGAHDTRQRDIQEIIHRLSTNEPVTDWQSDVQALKEQARHADHQTISAIETAFATALTTQTLSFRTLVALGELSHFSVSPLVTPALSLELGRGHNRISTSTFEHISLLNRLNTPESRLALHKLCDFFERLMVGMQNDETLAMIDYSAPQTGHNHLLFSISRFVTEEKKHTTNFLSHHHLTLVSEIHHSTTPTHPEAISGIDGGATNAAIYHYRHLADITTNRAQLGITQGNVMNFPIVKLAPGYYASYPGGKIRDIFAEPSASNRERFSIDTPAFIAHNNPDDEWVYETLNTPVTPAYPGNWNNNNLSLYRLDDLRDFFADLTRNDRTFFFDLSRLDTKSIHPVVLCSICVHNDEYLIKNYGEQKPTPVATEHFENELFPLGNPTPEERYTYDFLTSFTLRQTLIDDFGIELEQIPLFAQRHLLAWIEKASRADVENLSQAINYSNTPELRQKMFTVFSALETGNFSVTTLTDLAAQLSEADLSSLIDLFSTTITQHENTSTATGRDQTEQYAFLEGMLFRAKDILTTAWRDLSRGKTIQQVLLKTKKELESEQTQEQALSGRFRRELELFTLHTSKKNIDIRELAREQTRFRTYTETKGQALFLRALAARGELAPIPELHWRVDRTHEDYKRRLGVDLLKLLADRSSHIQQTLLEFGPGNGTAKRERADAQLENHYIDLGLADKLYFPLDTLIERCIDWGKIEQVLQTQLSPTEQHLLAETCSKLLMVTPGELHQNNFTYNHKLLDQLSREVNDLAPTLVARSPELLTTTSIPSTISARNAQGNVIYPHRIDLTARGGHRADFVRAQKLLAEHCGEYLVPEVKNGTADLYTFLPAFQRGLLISDFSNVRQLKPASLDVAFGVRSTVYVRDEQYKTFMTDMARALAPSGLYIDDNVRDNDGWRYRIAELSDIVSTLPADTQLHLVLGPGFEHEDKLRESVPLAVVMSRGSALADVKNTLESGYTLMPFDTFLADSRKRGSEYLQKLDPTGRLSEQS